MFCLTACRPCESVYVSPPGVYACVSRPSLLPPHPLNSVSVFHPLPVPVRLSLCFFSAPPFVPLFACLSLMSCEACEPYLCVSVLPVLF